MKKCDLSKKDWVDFFAEEMSGRRRATMTGHLDQCSECRKKAEELQMVYEGADTVRDEIRRALAAVDWDLLPDRIADHVFGVQAKPEPVRWGERFGSWPRLLQFKPIAAGLLIGLMIGSFAMYLVLRRPSPGPIPDAGFYASGEFLDKVELEMARRETLDYLRKSQYILLDFAQAPLEGSQARTAFGSEQAKELLSKKKFLNSQLDKFQMAKARAICDQIELLFLELTQISEDLSRAELDKIQSLIRDRQLLLKINLVRKELEEREV